MSENENEREEALDLLANLQQSLAALKTTPSPDAGETEGDR